MPGTISLSQDPRGILTARFDRPEKANSYTRAMLRELAAVVARTAEDPNVRALLLRGAGRHFSAGAAIEPEPSATDSAGPGIVQVCVALDGLPKPTIAAVDGACIGGAVALVCCCDVAIASTDAVFALPEVRLGFAPGPLTPFFMRGNDGRALRRFLLSGERFSAEQAWRMGLVQELCGPGEMDEAVARMADAFLQGAPGAVATAKRLLRRFAFPPLPPPDTLAELQEEFDAAAKTAEAQEGRASFREKRKPSWYRPP